MTALPAEAWSDRPSFMAVRDGVGHERLKAEWRQSLDLAATHLDAGFDGLCPLCAAPRRFGTPGDARSFDPREGMACAGCGLNARMRHALALLLDGLDPAIARVYLTEQASPGFVWLQRTVAHAKGSEYGFGLRGWMRLQRRFRSFGGRGFVASADVTALARRDASLDAVGCFDVLEHVPDYRAALREFARVLVPGGRLVITVPFIETAQDTLVRAHLRADGRVEHLEPEEIHGDPVSGGVLCYYHFGWDLLDALRDAGFRRAEWVRTFAPEYALFGVWALRAQR